MNPSGEVGEARKEEMGIEETMEAVVTTVDAMTSAVEAMDAMVTAVEMREWLEEGRTETERTTAVRFFSRALAWSDNNDLPLYWPGRLPGLVQLLGDCLLSHNSKAIKSGALLSLQYFLRGNMRDLIAHEANVSDNLVRLVRESNCHEIRDQAVWLLGDIFLVCSVSELEWWEETSPSIINSGLAFLPLVTDLIHKYAVIQKPTDTELSSLSKAIDALGRVCDILPFQFQLFPRLIEILPVLAGIFKEPGNHKEAQIPAGKCLAMMVHKVGANAFIESGAVEMLLETLRVGKETTTVLVKALQALAPLLERISKNSGHAMMQKVLGMGLLDVIHQVLERPNERGTDTDWPACVRNTLWEAALECLCQMTNGGHALHLCEAILDHKGLVELVLELALGMHMSQETRGYQYCANWLLSWLIERGSATLAQKLMSKESVFPFLSRSLTYFHRFDILSLSCPLKTVEACLALQGSEREQHIRRRLADSAGITDVIRRISLSPDVFAHLKEQACHILDTYLTNPLPPLPTHNLPTIIYIRNAQP